MINDDFDKYAQEYLVILNEKISKYGENSSYFSEYKVKDFHYELRKSGIDTSGPLRILDFGCGVGASIPHLHNYFVNSELIGIDVSEESLSIARNHYSNIAQFQRDFGGKLISDIGNLDAICAMCVFHHIDEEEHVQTLLNIRNKLKPNGLLMLYEHNPFNPITVRLVNNCPFDLNAKLISSKNMMQRCRDAGFRDIIVKYRVFFPSYIKVMHPFERALTWLPLGGQYYVFCVA